eukprot:6179474-Pleurochrysis_carterae.AAC.1
MIRRQQQISGCARAKRSKQMGALSKRPRRHILEPEDVRAPNHENTHAPRCAFVKPPMIEATTPNLVVSAETVVVSASRSSRSLCSLLMSARFEESAACGLLLVPVCSPF